MTITELRQLVIQWDLHASVEQMETTSQYQAMLDRLDWFGSTEWARYLPAHDPKHSGNYLFRLAQWLGNVSSDDDRKLLLEFALRVGFLSHADLCSLYHTAVSGPIRRWIVELERLSLDDPDFATKLEQEVHQRTWYCPITDSMDINEFYHVNHIVGVRHRPSFTLLRMLDKPLGETAPSEPSSVIANIKKFVQDPSGGGTAPSLKRLVLLEDFVGSGVQASGALDWALKNLDMPILFIPLVICAPGITKLSQLENNPRLRIQPMLKLDECDLLGPSRNGVEGIPNAELIEALAVNTFKLVAGEDHKDDKVPPHTPFGFHKTGSYFVSYSNAPNNTLPMIHHMPVTGGWLPLFPRSARL